MIFGTRPISKLSIDPPKPDQDRGGLAICLIVRNEERHIGEWINFHLKAGVGHFLIYDNGCTDDTIATAKRHLSPDHLTLMPWDQKLSDGRSGAELHNQVLAYAHCLRNFGGRFRWMAFIDVDEFLIPTTATSLLDALEPLSTAKHISLPWHMFGRNGFDAPPEGGILKNYLDRARDPLGSPHALNWKCIVDPCHVTGVRVHGFDIDGQATGVNDVGHPAKHSARSDAAFYSREAIQLNHYYTRSDAELQAKINRGSNKTVEAQKHLKRVMRIVKAIEADTVEDRTALAFLGRA